MDFGFLHCVDEDVGQCYAKFLKLFPDLFCRHIMILAANALGIGSVWLGTWPQMDRVKAQAELFHLPDTQISHSIIAFGYPKEESSKEKLIWEEDQVHYEK